MEEFEVFTEEKIEELMKHDCDIINQVIKHQKVSFDFILKHIKLINRVNLYHNQELSRDMLDRVGIYVDRIVKKVVYNCGVHQRSIVLYDDGSIQIGCFVGNYDECREAIIETYTNRYFRNEYLKKLDKLVN